MARVGPRPARLFCRVIPRVARVGPTPVGPGLALLSTGIGRGHL